MLSQDVSSIIAELQVAERAVALFCETYGLGWNDAHLAAVFEREHGAELAGRALRLISRHGCTWLEAVTAVQSTDRMVTSDMRVAA
jgi:hypothetical protein